MNRTSPFDLTGKVALVTGSSRGIGRAIAEAMARAGARVVISSRKLAACEAVARGIEAEGREAIALACNVSSKDDLGRLVDAALSKWGRIDVVVGNAATNPAYGPLATVEDGAFDKIIATNLKGNLWLCNLAIPQMAARREGAVILIASIAGLIGEAAIGAYGISKAAAMQLARNLAVEWGPYNVRVNCIAPGLVATDFARALWQDAQKRAKVEAATPLGRLGQPDDIAGIAVFLASAAAAFITGQVIVADGGRTIASL
ncbi:MAG: SDR family NAD(P)-dependent oxidoreductase [Pseudomonadota bacterium]